MEFAGLAAFLAFLGFATALAFFAWLMEFPRRRDPRDFREQVTLVPASYPRPQVEAPPQPRALGPGRVTPRALPAPERVNVTVVPPKRKAIGR